MIAGIRAAGFEAMEIWRTGDRLVMVADDWPRPLASALAATDARWQATMDRFQRRLAGTAAEQKWVPMTRIFALDEQPTRETP